jgi:enoyl-CoA hydratase
MERLSCAEPHVIFGAWLKTYRPTKPVILAAEGFARAGGTEILQGTDIRVAGESAQFGVTEVQRGLFPMAGSAVRLRRQIPYAIAAEMLLAGEDLPARAPGSSAS